MSVEDKVEDGTLYRKGTFRIRESGIKEILRGLGKGGFCSLGSGRLLLLEDDGEIFLEFCANVGTYETRVLALGLAFMIPLTEDEKNYVPPDPTPAEKENHDETPVDPVDPVVPDPQLP